MIYQFGVACRGGGWSTEGVRTVSNVTDESGQVSVSYQSSHLTAFAVLVDVSGEVGVSLLLSCTFSKTTANYLSLHVHRNKIRNA